ncbi:MAG: hypothetical protein AAF296_02545, partial [Pseudomonadota bacterium]
MLHPSTKKLIDRLIAMTAEGKIDWKEDDSDRVSYTTEGYSVALEKEPTEIVITTSDGRELERATASEIADVPDDADVSYADQVASMTRDATRKAKGIDEAISVLLAGIDLEGDGIPDLPVETLEADIAEANDIIEDVADDSAVVASVDTKTDVEPVDTLEPLVELTSEEIDTASENVTEAVARLADEVNGREPEDDSHMTDEETTASDTVTEESSSQLDSEISLSRLGAGFGLGTLQAKNPLSSPSGRAVDDAQKTDDFMETTLASNDDTPFQEKVVIDALDEIELNDAVTDETLSDVQMHQDEIAVSDVAANETVENEASVEDSAEVQDEEINDSEATT